jgi:hypothetical protein
MSFDVKKFIDGLHDYLSKAFAPINKRIITLEAKVAALEASVAAFEYKGVWRDGPTYVRHNSATHGGSLWIVRAEQTTQRPGDGADWTLACKRGRDARD